MKNGSSKWVYSPLEKGTSEYNMTELNILDIDISMTLIKEWSPVVKVVRLGRSIHYININ